MIPKIIHYCWFGGKSKPAMARMCINSWRKVLPDYEIMEWNESNFDMHSSPWIEKAYEAKKWAFVADYVRFKVLHEMGGVYFDTDLFLKKDISKFISHRFFSAWDFPLDWKYLLEYNVATKEGEFLLDKNTPQHMCMCGILVALMGAEPGHPILKDCLDYYDSISWEGINSDYNNQSVICDDIMLNRLWKYGLKMNSDVQQILDEDILILPPTIFAGAMAFQNSENYAIHMCSSTWRDGKKMRLKMLYKTIRLQLIKLFS